MITTILLQLGESPASTLSSTLRLTFSGRSGEWINVHDVAAAHVLAIQKEAAAGERIIVSAGPYKLQDWGELIQGGCDLSLN